MKIIHKNQTNSFKNSNVCFGKEYPLKDKDIGGAVIEIRGRYPDKARIVNLECKELIYVLEGSGKVFVEGKASNFTKGDMFVICPKEKYYWQANCVVLICCTPPFDPKQYKLTK